MSHFRPLTTSFSAAPQITASDVAEAGARGFVLIVNNRPEGESDDQTPGRVIEEACRANGLAYLAIPITHSGFSEAQVDALVEALRQVQGPVLGYCRSGTRSSFLWALAQAKLGRSPDEIAAQAADGGYDVTPIRPMLDMLSGAGRTS